MKKLLTIWLMVASVIAISATMNTGKFDQLTTNNASATKIDVKKNLDIQTTGGIYLPSGTTAQQPSPIKDGMIRYNTTTGSAEIYANGVWGAVGGGGGISDWLTATPYSTGDVVIESQKIYQALTDHTSGTFATDLGNGDWQEISAQTAVNLTGAVTSTGAATSLGSFTSSNLSTALTDETGSGSAVFATSPTLVTPTLGAASATSVNGTTIPSSKTLVVTTDKLSVLSATSSSELAGVVSDETGSGALVFGTSPTLVTPALGTPSALVGTNITGTAAGLTAGTVTTNANLTGHITSTGNATLLGSFTSSNLSTALTDETGSGSAVFATTPTLVTPVLGAATGTSLALGGTKAASAVIDVQSTTQGSLAVPRMTTAQRIAIAAPDTGLKVYDTDFGAEAVYNGSIWTFGFANLQLDDHYVAIVAANGTVTGENRDWINGNCTNAGPRVCTLNTGLITTAMVCNANTSSGSSAANKTLDITSSTTTITLGEREASTAAGGQVYPIHLTCNKTGADYLSSSSSAYASANADYNWRAFTPTFSAGFGTTTSLNCLESVQNGQGWIRCKFTTGTVAGSVATMSLPAGWTTASTYSTYDQIGYVAKGNSLALVNNVLVGPSATILNFSAQSSTNSSLTAYNGNDVFASTTAYSMLVGPISLQNRSVAPYIVGSFQGMVSTPGTIKPVLVSADIASGGTNSNVDDSFLSASSNTGTGEYSLTFTTNYWSSAPKCWVIIKANAGYMAIRSSTESTTTWTYGFQANGAGSTNGAHTVFCKGNKN